MARRNHGNISRGFLTSYLASLGADVNEAAIKALAEGAELVVEEAKGRAPVKSGKLRDSIHAEPRNNGKNIRVVADAKNEKGEQYAQYVEYDPRIHHPFLYPAMRAKEDEVKQHIIDAIRKAVRKE